MASPEAIALKASFKAFQEQAMNRPDISIEELREMGEGFGQLASELPDVSVEQLDANGVACEWVTPPGVDERKVILYVHGGGYMICSPASHRRFVSHLASAIGARALVVDYRLAPEHQHPAPLEDACTAYNWLLDRGVDANKVIVAGDSAGGGLAISTILKLREAGKPLPAACLPISPWTDMTMSGESYRSRAELDYMVSKTGLDGMASAFLGDGSATDVYASPIFADYAGFPPLFIQVGDEEVLLDDARAVAEKAKAAGVDVRIDVFPEMQHVFQLAAGNLPEADDALSRFGDWTAERLN